MVRELKDVEQSFFEQLRQLGWAYCGGGLDNPAVAGRPTFAKAEQLHALNPENPMTNSSAQPAPSPHSNSGAFADAPPALR